MKNTAPITFLILTVILAITLLFTACNGQHPDAGFAPNGSDTPKDSITAGPTSDSVALPNGTSNGVTSVNVTTNNATTPKVTENNVTIPVVTTNKATTPVVTTNNVTTPMVTTYKATTPVVTTNNVTTPVVTTKVTTTEVTTTKTPETTTGDIVTPHVHMFGEWRTVITATCTKDGSEERACSCGEKETRKIKSVGHTEVVDKAIPPTCSKTGVTEGKHCSACGKVLQKQTLIDKLSHKPGEWVVEKQATKTSDGSKIRKCTVCGKSVESEIIYATGSQGLAYHVYDDKTTCEVIGIGTCTDTDIYVPAYIDGYKVTAIGAVAFADNQKLTSIAFANTVKTIEREAFINCTGLKTVVFPDGIVSIGFSSFSDCYALDNLVIPGSVERIGVCAFFGCRSLKSLTIKDGVQDISDMAFQGCKSLTSVTIPGSVKSIAPYAFIFCSGLEVVTISNGVKSIEESVFQNCTSLTSVIIHESVQNIDQLAFSDCTSLQLISYKGKKAQWDLVSKGNGWDANTGSYTVTYSDKHIHIVSDWIIDVEATQSQKGSKHGKCVDCGETVTEELLYSTGSKGLHYKINSDGKTCTVLGIGSCQDTELVIGDYINGYKVTGIGDTAFISCKSITSLVISDSVTSIGNSSFRGCPSLKSVVIGNGIKIVTEGAFDYCVSLVSVTFGNKVESINEESFSDCTSLKSITLPNSIKNLSMSIFSGNKRLASIIYQGTEAEWNSISKHEYWAEGLTIYTIVCSDKTIHAGCSKGLAYKVNSDNKTCTITGIGTCTDTDLNIGGAIDGYMITAIGEKAFMNCDIIRSVTIGGSITTIDNYAFIRANNLEKVTINNGIISIGRGAFKNCATLTSISLPESVTSIDEMAFDDCWALTSINIPQSVNTIGRSAFRNCSSLTSIILPEGITAIGQSTFANCDNLNLITIPVSVTSIDKVAFSNCRNLTDIIFTGTKEQWTAISKGDRWDLNAAIRTIHCTDGDIEI